MNRPRCGDIWWEGPPRSVDVHVDRAKGGRRTSRRRSGQRTAASKKGPRHAMAALVTCDPRPAGADIP